MWCSCVNIHSVGTYYHTTLSAVHHSTPTYTSTHSAYLILTRHAVRELHQRRTNRRSNKHIVNHLKVSQESCINTLHRNVSSHRFNLCCCGCCISMGTWVCCGGGQYTCHRTLVKTVACSCGAHCVRTQAELCATGVEYDGNMSCACVALMSGRRAVRTLIHHTGKHITTQWDGHVHVQPHMLQKRCLFLCL